jgi:hypothetical protein
LHELWRPFRRAKTTFELTAIGDAAVRRAIIRTLFPLFFCAVPPLAAGLIAAAVPPLAREFYLAHLTSLDVLIIAMGLSLFLAQTILSLQAMRWRGTGFDERPDSWLSNLSQAAEWFPLLGLIGTVAGILQTFSQVKEGVSPAKIIQLYAPAITATGSGLLMALINIFPTWIVLVGRDLIRTLGGGPAPVDDGLATAKPARDATTVRR